LVAERKNAAGDIDDIVLGRRAGVRINAYGQGVMPELKARSCRFDPM